MLELDLQRFSEGGADAAPAETGAEFQADAALEEYRQKRFPNRAKKAARQQKQAVEQPARQPAQEQPAKEGPSASPAPTEEQQAPDRKTAFRELIKGEYKDEAGEYIEGIIKERFKNQKDLEGQLKKLQPALDALYQKNGVEAGDVDALVKAITNDDSLYEQEALEKGIPVETLKEMKAFQREAEEFKARQEEEAQRQFFERHIQTLVEQGEQLKQLYPNFDLRTEMQNPEFQRLTSPNVGVDVRTAFEVVHRDQLDTLKAKAIADKTREDMSRAYMSGSQRPAENGLSGSTKSVSLSDDPSQWDKTTLRRMISDVKAGKKIAL